jgi:hypothetical protein
MKAQVPTIVVTAARIVGSPEFARGLADKRNGIPFDPRIDSWEYERGRLFACIAPLNMELRIGSNLNPKAVALYAAASSRDLIP